MVHINQTGYLPASKKEAIVTDEAEGFKLFESATGAEVFSGKLSAGEYDPVSGDTVQRADFSGLNREGRYLLVTDSGSESYNFEIRSGVYSGLKNDLVKALYFQRCGCALDEKHAGVYKHAECHTGLSEFLDDRTKTADMTGGWHDAGDYGRYTSPAAVTIGHLLYAYEFFPQAFTEPLNIPESGNGIPDILNETRYEIEWLLKMQDPISGGVYHKLTTYNHAAFVMPEEDKGTMLIFPFSSMSTGGFAGSMALGYRVYKKYDPAFADKMLSAAKLAFSWLEANPEMVQAPNNPPGGDTGGYFDRSDLDERYWAAAELYRVTGEEKYHDAFKALAGQDFDKTGFGWEDVSGLGTVSYLYNEKADPEVQKKLRDVFLAKAEELYNTYSSDKYGTALTAMEYVWGSNMVVGNHGILLAIAELLTKDAKYRDAAAAQLDYLLGKNAMGISYVTGYGENAYRNPHLRPAVADGIDDSMPGWVSGGPCSWLADPKAKELVAEGTPPAKCYADDWECFSLNEITIYWNSPFVFVAAYLDN